MQHDGSVAAADRRPLVVIVGGGYCGAMCALHLLRDHAGLPLRLEVLEPRETLGAGLAYSTGDPAHRINVSAARMSPFLEDELHFDRWLRADGADRRDPAALLPDGRLYVQRAEVGRYVAHQLREAVAAGPEAEFRHTRERAVAARPAASGFAVRTADGGVRQADVLVLAVGHPPPLLPPALRAVAGDPRLLADPWDEAALAALPAEATVLILGTGLTGCDVAASLRARGHRGRLLAVSRRGLLPRPRTTLPVEAEGDFATDPARSAGELLRQVRAAITRAVAAGRPWENVIDALRRQGAQVWGALPPPERHRFLRHLRAFWDVHRFQSAPQVADLIATEQASGELEVLAASLRRVTATPTGLLVALHPRRAAPHALDERMVGAIVACTGPGHAGVVAGNPLLRSLANAGVLRADDYGLGIAVDPFGRCLDAAGQPATRLFVAGPLARGTDGELMGLPQVSTQPRAVAGRVADLLARAPAETAPSSDTTCCAKS